MSHKETCLEANTTKQSAITFIYDTKPCTILKVLESLWFTPKAGVLLMFSEQLEPHPWFKVMGPGHARPRLRDAWGHVATISLFTLTSNKMYRAKLAPRTTDDAHFGESSESFRGD